MNDKRGECDDNANLRWKPYLVSLGFGADGDRRRFRSDGLCEAGKQMFMTIKWLIFDYRDTFDSFINAFEILFLCRFLKVTLAKSCFDVVLDKANQSAMNHTKSTINRD